MDDKTINIPGRLESLKNSRDEASNQVVLWSEEAIRAIKAGSWNNARIALVRATSEAACAQRLNDLLPIVEEVKEVVEVVEPTPLLDPVSFGLVSFGLETKENKNRG